MIPAGFAGVEAQLWMWMIAMIRPGAAFLAAPVFGASFVPVQLRLVIALAIGIPALANVNFQLPEGGLATIEGVMLVGGEVMAGVAIGFAVQIGFSAALLAGETISNAMGLGFAGMVDPASGQQNPMLASFLSIWRRSCFSPLAVTSRSRPQSSRVTARCRPAMPGSVPRASTAWSCSAACCSPPACPSLCRSASH
jgi:hypothetical protein